MPDRRNCPACHFRLLAVDNVGTFYNSSYFSMCIRITRSGLVDAKAQGRDGVRQSPASVTSAISIHGPKLYTNKIT